MTSKPEVEEQLDSGESSASEKVEMSLEMDADYRIIYSNAASFFKTAWDFQFDFGIIAGGHAGRAPLSNNQQVSVVMSPLHAKLFILLAAREIDKWEKVFGEIVIPSAILKSQGLESASLEIIDEYAPSDKKSE